MPKLKNQNATFRVIFKHCALSIMVISRLTNSSNSLRRGQESSVVNKDFNENSPGTRSGPSKSSSQSKIRQTSDNSRALVVPGDSHCNIFPEEVNQVLETQCLKINKKSHFTILNIFYLMRQLSSFAFLTEKFIFGHLSNI